MTYPSGKIVRYGLSSIKRPRTVTLEDGANTTALASTISYRPFGGLQRMDYGNGLQRLNVWDLDYRQTISRDLPVQELRYFYDEADNIVDIRDIADTSKRQRFSYDGLDRLIDADGIYGDITYTYDEVGNRLSRTDETGTESYRYLNTRNVVRDVTAATGELIDYNRNATGSTTRIGDDAYGYNRYERMSVATVDGERTTYRYNGIGERILKTDANLSETVYHYDLDGLLISESARDGSILAEYVYLDGQPLALLKGDEIYYYHLNHLGTPQKLSDANQVVVWEGDYQPFGNVEVVVEAVTNNIRFPGQYFDEESELHYNYFRDYAPGSGRYMESDPIGLGGGLNTYGYTLQNPVKYTDPLGLATLSVGGSGTFFVGGVGGSVTATGGVDTNLRACVSFTVCGRAGVGVSINGSGVASVGTGLFCPGDAGSLGGFVGGGVGPFASVSTRTNKDLETTTTAGFGLGAGGNAGAQLCETKTICIN